MTLIESMRVVAGELATHLGNSDFVDALPGFFRTDEVSRARMLMVTKRLSQLASLPA